MSGTLLIGSSATDVELLVAGLDAELLEVPDPFGSVDGSDMASWPWADRLDSWRTEASTGGRHSKVVVAVWERKLPEATALASIDDSIWFERCEAAFARWFAAMGVAIGRCADQGAIVAVIERPSPLDCSGRAIETALARVLLNDDARFVTGMTVMADGGSCPIT